MRLHAGTSGFSYKEWKGTFYPEDLPAAGMLRYYAERLSAVEINNTFYRMPRAAMLTAWAEQVPPGFVFVLKASQRITHQKRLKDAADNVAYFFNQAASLGDRLGPVLFQLPPNLKKDVPRLADFLTVLPESARAAFEFRHESWFDEETYGALASSGAALCLAEDEDLATPLVATAGWGYARLRRQDYTSGDLESRALQYRSQAWTDLFVFFKHEEGGRGPALAADFTHLFAQAKG
ncbi:MAG TPA: DUF72 domain-containing protein [Thermoanaerobaculia bacterium]|nr:DUF72 domain-containing protein [Thermoanaerobaculia bacterium]